jgi:hypothetical protein
MHAFTYSRSLLLLFWHLFTQHSHLQLCMEPLSMMCHLSHTLFLSFPWMTLSNLTATILGFLATLCHSSPAFIFTHFCHTHGDRKPHHYVLVSTVIRSNTSAILLITNFLYFCINKCIIVIDRLLHQIHGCMDVLLALWLKPYFVFLTAHHLSRLSCLNVLEKPTSLDPDNSFTTPPGRSERPTVPHHLHPELSADEWCMRHLALLLNSDNPKIWDWA